MPVYLFVVCTAAESAFSAATLRVMENCTGFTDTAVIENEGQFLQDMHPTSKAYGGAGRFRFDPPAHLTEVSAC